MARVKQPVSINGIEFDALINESRTLEASVPEYSVEEGFSVADAIIIGSEKLSMTLFVTNTPVTWYLRHGSDEERVTTVCETLEQLFYDATPVTIVTDDNVYSDMAIENLELSKSLETGYSREIPISFKKIRITAASTTTIPDGYGKSGATGSSAGSANTTSGTVSTSSASSKTTSGSSSSSSASSGSSSGSSSSSKSSSGSSNKGSILYNASKSAGLLN